MISIIYRGKIYSSDNNGQVSFNGNKIYYTKYENHSDENILVYVEKYDFIKFTSGEFSFRLPQNRINSIIVDGNCFDLEWDKEKFVDGNGNGKNIIETEYVDGTLEIVLYKRDSLPRWELQTRYICYKKRSRIHS